MISNFKLIVVLVGLCVANIAADYIDTEKADQHNILDLMVRTSDVSDENPQRSMDCFSYYVPILNDITAEYERSYGACLQKSSDAKSLVDNSTLADRDNLESSANDACKLLSKCNTLKNSIDYFQCYVDGGSQNSKTMYSISANASDILADVREKYRLIENDEYRCTNASERAYVENTANTYDDLHSCILGLTPVPSSLSNAPSVEPVAVNSFKAPIAVDGQAENVKETHSEKYYVERGINKFKRLH